jgi:hypothetical protein
MKNGMHLLSYITLLALFLQGCAGMGSASHSRDLAKTLMERDAQTTASDLFDARFDPKKSRLITSEQVRKWISENKVDVKSYPAAVQKAINDESTLALLVPKFIPVAAPDIAFKSYDIGGIYLPLIDPSLDIGGWWLVGGGCVKKCEKCRGCKGPNNICYCAYICCTTCDAMECWKCQPCANNP